MTFAVPWTSGRITADGLRKLRESGFAPPGAAAPGDARPLFATIPLRPTATCPWCGSADTALENLFGPTLCRTLFWCNRCRQPFEQFKAV
jgi:ring-1,2-phenylacetyl-CoA epoxidase subunit PaaD